MNHWQDIVVVGLIVAAAGYLVRLFWRRMTRRGSTCCDTCGIHLPKSKGESKDSLLHIDTPTRNSGDE